MKNYAINIFLFIIFLQNNIMPLCSNISEKQLIFLIEESWRETKGLENRPDLNEEEKKQLIKESIIASFDYGIAFSNISNFINTSKQQIVDYMKVNNNFSYTDIINNFSEIKSLSNDVLNKYQNMIEKVLELKDSKTNCFSVIEKSKSILNYYVIVYEELCQELNENSINFNEEKYLLKFVYALILEIKKAEMNYLESKIV
jgi:hypothetical protein